MFLACLVLEQSQNLASPALLVRLPLGHLVCDGVLKLLDLSTQLIHHLGVDKDVRIVQVLQQEKGPAWEHEHAVQLQALALCSSSA